MEGKKARCDQRLGSGAKPEYSNASGWRKAVDDRVAPVCSPGKW